jgi:NAD(P)-dependent dehydrogenase (short-subunit alcohol dehydrogenase family)
MQIDFTGKVAFVTGSSRGIGRAIALQFAEAGARVVIQYRQNKQAAEGTFSELAGDSHILLQGDVSDPRSVQEMTDAVLGAAGRVDVLVNNAGIYEDHPIATVAYDKWQGAWQRVMATNLIGPANLSFCVAQKMMEAGGGKIVNVSSRGAFRGEPHGPAYGASKAGLNAMSQSLAQALAPHNVFVYVVAPGFVETDMAASTLAGPKGDEIRNQSPLGRVATPEEVARTVVFLASEGTEFLTGCIVDVNGASYLRT